jgi:hypothetical protein
MPCSGHVQADVLRACGISQLLDAALSGYNVCIFAYGQTVSRRTRLMSDRVKACGERQAGPLQVCVGVDSVGHLLCMILLYEHIPIAQGSCLRKLTAAARAASSLVTII